MVNYPWDPAYRKNTSQSIARQTEVTYLQYKKIEQFEDVGYFLQFYVVEGGTVSKNITHNNRIDISETVVSFQNEILHRDDVEGIKLKNYNSTYFVDFYDGDYWVDTAHPAGTEGTDYLTLATVTTDINGNISSITDTRGVVGGMRLKDGVGIPLYDDRLFIVNEADVQLLQSKLKSGDGIRYAVLGDSIEVGVGQSGAIPYGEANTINFYSGHVLFALSLIKSDDNFLAVDPKVFAVADPMESFAPCIVESHKLVVSESPSFTYTCKQKGAVKYDKLTIYYLERTADAAARFDVVTSLGTTTIDTYVAPVTYAGVSHDIGLRLKKRTITIPAQSDISFTLNNVNVIDRGNGVAADGTAVVIGFALGEGVDFVNYSVSSTTLLNNSEANQSRGITTDERLQKAYAMNANVISIGWGTNDSKTGVSTVAAFKNDLKTRIDQIRVQNPKTIIILNTAPRGKKGSIYENNPAYNQAIREVAIEKNVNCLDVEYLFDKLDNTVYADDVHPSPLGYYTIGKAFPLMFKTEFVFPRTEALVTVDSGKMFSEIALPENADFSGSWVEIGNIIMNRPSDKINLRLDAKINLARTQDFTSMFRLRLYGYSGLNGTGTETPAEWSPGDYYLDETFVTSYGRLDTSDPAEIRTAIATLSAFWYGFTARSYKVVVEGMNFQVRQANAKSKLSIMFFS